MRRVDLGRLGLTLAAPVLAVLVAIGLTTLVLLAVGDPVTTTWGTILDAGADPRSLALMLSSATTYYLSAVAVAIGFRMGLFNIGVDGQYRLAAFVAALVAGSVSLPAPLHVGLAIVVAALVGAMWASIAGLLKVTRGVSEVISTIMLNAIATSLVAFLLREFSSPVLGANNIGTEPIPASGRVPGLPLVPGTPERVYGLVVLAVAVGIGYAVLVDRTRFGFDLRAAGGSQSAAVASGVDVRRMVVSAMLLSGAVAGLVGLPELLGASYTYSQTFPAGLGFTGIAIALLGRNHPVGIALGALLWAYLDVSANPLQILAGVSSEIVEIMKGITVLAVVVAYEVVRRHRLAREQRQVARELTAGARTPEQVPA